MATLLLTNDYPPTISGISTVFYQIWLLLPQGEDLILTPAVKGGGAFDRGCGRDTVRYPAIEARLFPVKLINFFVQFMYTFYLVIRYRVKLIHAGQILNGGAIGYIFERVFGIPYIIWVYGDETKPIYMKSKIHKYFIDLLMKKADRIITNSPIITDEFLQYGIKKEKIVEIIPGVDTEVFFPGEPPKELIERYSIDGKIVLVTVARLTPRKGQDMVISALPDILKKYPNVVYLIVGDGPYRKSLQELSEDKAVSANVIFAGKIAGGELPSHYRLADIYVMPNREVKDSTDSIEGFGISFIEAGGCEKPVIGGRSGGAVFAVEDNESGILINPESIEELTDALFQLLDNPQRAREIGKSGVQRARTFDWKVRAKEISRLHRRY